MRRSCQHTLRRFNEGAANFLESRQAVSPSDFYDRGLGTRSEQIRDSREGLQSKTSLRHRKDHGVRRTAGGRRRRSETNPSGNEQVTPLSGFAYAERPASRWSACQISNAPVTLISQMRRTGVAIERPQSSSHVSSIIAKHRLHA